MDGIDGETVFVYTTLFGTAARGGDSQMLRPDDRSAMVRDVMRAAGWSPDRDVSVRVRSWEESLAEEFTPFPAAREALRRYGELRVEQKGAGMEYARESFTIDPTLARGEANLFREVETRIGTRLFPLGEAGNGRVFLGISEDGSVFAFLDDIWLQGRTIESAIDSLVLGAGAVRILG